MFRIKVHTLKEILTSEYWLIASLSGMFFCFFALNRGGVDVCIQLASFFLIINVLFGKYQMKEIPSCHLLTAGICVFLLVVSCLVSMQQSHTRFMANVVKMLSVVFAIHCLSQKNIDHRIRHLFVVILVLSVCWQFTARNLYNMPFGTYTNRHYLASFAVLGLPLIVYFFWVTTGWYKFILVLLCLLDLDLLLKTGSRPAWLATACGVLFATMFFTKGWYKWLTVALIFCIVTILHVTGYAGFSDEINDLIFNLSAEERFQFWSDSWKMLKDNSLLGWILGHGIGSVRVSFPQYSVPEYSHFNFPHCYFLQILYENGVIGVVMVFGGLSLLFFSLVKKTRQTSVRGVCALSKCMIVAFLGWLIHCGLTVSFYGKYSLYPLGFILGTMLVLVQEMSRGGAAVHIGTPRVE